MALKTQIYSATADRLAKEYLYIRKTGTLQEISVIHDLTLDLADAYAEIDPDFDKVSFLNVANPD